MICTQHNDRETEIKCTCCDTPLCEVCQVHLGNQVFCKECVTKTLDSANGNQQQPFTEETPRTETNINKKNVVPAMITERRSRLWTFLFSLIPGVGYLYLGLMKRGVQALVTFFGTIFIGNLIGLEQIIAFVLPVLMFYTIFDAQQLVRKINAGDGVVDEQLFPGDWFNFQQSWLGYALVGIGTLALLDNVMQIFSTYWFRSAVGPLAIIGVGIYILYKNVKRV